MKPPLTTILLATDGAPDSDEAGRAAADAVADIYGQRALATVRARATELPEGEARTRQLALAERLAGL